MLNCYRIAYYEILYIFYTKVDVKPCDSLCIVSYFAPINHVSTKKCIMFFLVSNAIMIDMVYENLEVTN